LRAIGTFGLDPEHEAGQGGKKSDMSGKVQAGDTVARAEACHQHTICWMSIVTLQVHTT